MAITWGSTNSSSSGNQLRLGYEFSQSPSSVGTGTSSVTVTLKVYVWTRYPVSDSSNTLTITGNFSHSGSESISHGGNGQTTLLQTETRTVSTSYSGTVKSSFTASLSGVNAVPGTASVSGSWTTAKRPITAPWAPNDPGASRNSDTSHTIFWTNDNPTAAGHPYTSIEVQRWDNVGNSWSTIATLGVVSSYTNTSTRSDRQYRWRVRAKNSAGSSGYVYTGYWSTTPASPNAPSATKISDDIKITWTNRATKGTNVEVWHATDGVWDGTALAVLSGQPTSYTHNNPDPTKTHTYRLKCQAGTADDAPTTYSSYSGQSNVVQLLTNPAAPTGLAPASGVRDAAAADVVLTWIHNAPDSTAQTGYDLQYRLDGGSWTTITDLASSFSRRTFPAGTLPNGVQMEWQVRTYGDYAVAPAYSPWSAVSTLVLSAAPQAGVIFPDDVTPVDTSRITAQWSYYDEEGSTQSQYRVKLYSAGGATLLEDRAGSGSGTSQAMASLLYNDTSYRLGVSVRDGAGLWSPETTQDFTVVYSLPPVPSCILAWDPDNGSVVVSLENATPDVGQAEVAYSELWRSTDWLTYELVATDIPPNGTVTDYAPAIGGENVYQVVAVTELGASAQSEPLILETPSNDGWFWINGGADFSTRTKVRYEPTLSRDFSRDKTLNLYAGRDYAVETVGEHRSKQYNLTVSVLGDDDTTLAELEAVADLPGPLLFRTPLGDRVHASLEGMPSSRTNGYEIVNMRLTRVDEPDIDRRAFDPVVYRTNWNPDPRATSIASYRATGDMTLVADAGDSYISVLENTAGTTIYVDPFVNFTVDGLGLRVGDTLTMTYDLQVTMTVGVASQIAQYNGASATARPTTVQQSPDDGWVTRTVTQTITALGTDGYFRALIWMDDTMPVGEGFYFKRFSFEVNSPDGAYFDGDTWEGDRTLTPRWSGTPDASPSQLMRGGTQ